MVYILYRIGIILALYLPIKIAYQIADILGSLYYLLAIRDRKIAADNIRVALEQTNKTDRVQHITRKVFINFARYLVEFFRTSKIDLEYVKENIKIEGRDNLDRALQSGKGVLVVSAHLGNWELGAMVLSMLGYRVNAIAWTHKNRLVNNFFLHQRQSKGLTIIPIGTRIRRVFTALKNNEAVAFLADIDFANPYAGIPTKLFGRDTMIPKGPAVFSLKACCPIVPIFMLREDGHKFRLIFEQPIIYKPTKNREYDLTKLTQKIAKIIESYIALYPDQWFMLTPRWQSIK
jgi:KDO2-lipid IV(A) lauroyltransferase